MVVFIYGNRGCRSRWNATISEIRRRIRFQDEVRWPDYMLLGRLYTHLILSRHTFLSRFWFYGKQWNRSDISFKSKTPRPFPIYLQIKDKYTISDSFSRIVLAKQLNSGNIES